MYSSLSLARRFCDHSWACVRSVALVQSHRGASEKFAEVPDGKPPHTYIAKG